MFEFLATPDFAHWFDALGDSEAEEVATALEVLAARAIERASPAPEHGSSLLLWYEDAPQNPSFWHARLDDFLRRAHYARTLATRLESASAVSRFEQLSPEAARRATMLLSIVKHQAGFGALRASVGGATAELGRELRDACNELAALLGTDVAWSMPEALALRELQFAVRDARLRILFGVDRARRQGLLVLGERLDRHFYGDSVRHALRQWEQFCSGDRADFAPAPAR